MTEIARHIKEEQRGNDMFNTLNQTLIDLERYNLLSESMMFDLRQHLKDYLQLLQEHVKKVP